MKYVLLTLALFQSALVLFLRWGHPLASPHAFRETQTALTCYTMLHGGPWLAYQTPVMGPPWTIPFEFPTFQWVVAGVVYATSISLDNTGRLVNWLFMVGCCLPLSRLGRRCGMVDAHIPCVLFLASPLYLYWGTAFLIETCSLFLCLMFLWMVEDERWVLALIIGCLAGMTKLPTVVPFVALALISRGGWAWLIGALAVSCGVGWNHYTDLLKAQNPLSALLMSSQPAQRLHDFGTITQRLSWKPWGTLWRSIKDLL